MSATAPAGAPRQDGGAEAGAVAAPRRRRSGTGWIVAGLCILLLPVVLTLANDRRIDQVTGQYAAQARAVQPPERSRELLAAAHAYNDRLDAAGHHAMPPTPGTPGLDEYLATLDLPATAGVMGRVTIPSIGVDLPIRHTTNPAVLYQGAGHMFGSDLPVGGPGTTSVISAHTGMVNATMFDNLPRLHTGDDVFVDVLGQTLRYQVRGRKVVGPTDASAITYEEDRDKLVLVTCTPYGINTDRLLVEAVRVPWNGEPVRVGWRPHLSWWMVVDLLVVLAVPLVLWWRRRRDEKKREESRREAEAAAALRSVPDA